MACRVLATELVSSGAALSVAAAALRQLVADEGAERAAQLWQATGLDLLSFMPSVMPPPQPPLSSAGVVQADWKGAEQVPGAPAVAPVRWCD